jgi:hypothetical protein
MSHALLILLKCTCKSLKCTCKSHALKTDVTYSDNTIKMHIKSLIFKDKC